MPAGGIFASAALGLETLPPNIMSASQTIKIAVAIGIGVAYMIPAKLPGRGRDNSGLRLAEVADNGYRPQLVSGPKAPKKERGRLSATSERELIEESIAGSVLPVVLSNIFVVVSQVYLSLKSARPSETSYLGDVILMVYLV